MTNLIVYLLCIVFFVSVGLIISIVNKKYKEYATDKNSLFFKE
jgi:hypothetical protein